MLPVSKQSASCQRRSRQLPAAAARNLRSPVLRGRDDEKPLPEQVIWRAKVPLFSARGPWDGPTNDRHTAGRPEGVSSGLRIRRLLRVPDDEKRTVEGR